MPSSAASMAVSSRCRGRASSRSCNLPGAATDNNAIIAETVKLRAERARLLGFSDFAEYRLDDAMAKTPQAVRELLDTVWAQARAKAVADRDDLEALIRVEGGNFALSPWDWRYYAEKLR